MPEPTWRNQLDGARPILRRALFYAKGRAVRRPGRRGVSALEVDVLTGGGFDVQPVKRKGRHTVTPKEFEEVLPLTKPIDGPPLLAVDACAGGGVKAAQSPPKVVTHPDASRSALAGVSPLRSTGTRRQP